MVSPVRALDLDGVHAQYATVVASKRCSILVLGAVTETGARLELRTVPTDAQEPEELRVDFVVRDTPCIVVANENGEPRRRRVWSMVCGPMYEDPNDAMGEVLDWVRTRILPRTYRARAVGGPRTGIALQPLRDLMSEVATGALNRCDQDALALALTFEPRLRFTIYERLVADESGRLADLVKSCPGALLFALGLIEHDVSHGSGAAGERLIADVIDGRRLKDAIDDAIDAWLASIPDPTVNALAPRKQRRSRVRVFDPSEKTRLALADASPIRAWATPLTTESRASLRTRQRLLIRRASAEVSTRSLWLPPPLVLIPEDIPRDERENARWFGVMKSHAFTLTRHPDIDPCWQDAVCRFLSRHAAVLARATGVTLAMPVHAVLAYAHAENRWLDRDSAPTRVRAGWERWYREAHQREEHALLAAQLQQRGITQAHPFPAPLFDARLACTADLELAPITSVADLFAEAREMEHCIARHVFAALAGKVVAFRGTVHGERVTVELACAGSQPNGSWRLADVRRARNQPPSAAALAAIRVWAVKVITWQDMAEIAAHARAPRAGDAFECPF